MDKIKQELKGLSHQELLQRVDAFKRELFSLRLQAATAPVKDVTLFKKLRRSVACALTYARQKSVQEVG